MNFSDLTIKESIKKVSNGSFWIYHSSKKSWKYEEISMLCLHLMTSSKSKSVWHCLTLWQISGKPSLWEVAIPQNKLIFLKRVPKLNSNILKFLIRKALWNQKKGTWKALLSQQDDRGREWRETTAEGFPKTLLKFYSIVKSCTSLKRGLEKEEIIIFNCGDFSIIISF